MKTVRVLALSPVPEEGAGGRFRVYQYIPYLQSNGFQVTVSPFFTPDFFRIVYQKGKYLRKGFLFATQAFNRLQLLATHNNNYDLFFVYREAFPVGPPLIELALSGMRDRPLIYDFDDAIFLPNSSDANKLVSMLKYPKKVSQIIRASDRVVAGNACLAEYARAHNKAVSVIPTCVDTTRFVPRSRHEDSYAGTPVVGWIGSHSTAKYLESLLPVFGQMSSGCRFTLYVVGSPTSLPVAGLEVTQVPWALEREVEDFQRCDVGVYPLWDDPWARGKSGFKAIQFMACGVPVVAAPVGVNREIIQDGVNGFLAASEKEWREKLSLLIKNPGLRRELGMAGRKTVEERYSLDVTAPRLLRIFQEVCGVGWTAGRAVSSG